MKKMERFPEKNPNPVMSVEKDGTILYSNVAGEPLLQEWGVGVGEKIAPYIRDFVQKVISQNSPEKMEVKAGRRVYLVEFYPLPEEECVNLYGFDISDQKELEGKLKESEKKYRNIVETANENIWVVNAEGRTTYVNEKIAGMLGYSQEEIIGRPLWDFINEENKVIAKLNLEKRQQGTNESHEFKLIRKDGSSLWTIVTAKPLFDKDGKFTGSLSVLTDITERKWIEEALRKSETRFRALVTASSEVIYYMSPDWRIMNRLCGRGFLADTESTNPTWLHEYILPDDQPHVTSVINEAIRTKSIFELEHRVRQADGSIGWTYSRAVPILDANGEIVEWFGAASDITERKRVEKEQEQLLDAIQQEKDRLAALINSITDEVWFADTQKKLTLINPSASYAFNICAEDEIEVEKLAANLEVYHPDGSLRPVEEALPLRALLGEVVKNQEEIVRMPVHGELRYRQVSAAPVCDTGGNIIGSVSVVRDITESKKAEEKIQNLANIVESSNDAIMTHSFYTITSWNKGAEQIYGYSTEEIIGKDVSMLEPASLKGEVKQLSEMIKQGEKVQRYETLRLRKDGTIINVSITLSPIIDASGKLTAISGIVRDITERKRAEEKLRKSEEKYRNIVETVNEGISLISSEGIITYVNQKMADMLGYAVEEIISRTIWDFVEEKDKSTVTTSFEKRRRGSNDSYEIKLIRKDGSYLWVFINSKPLFEKGGKFIGALNLHTDITKRKETEEFLANIEIARKKEIHHRIKNNLQVISSLLDLQAEQFRDKKDIKDSEILQAFKESQDRVISMALIHEELYKGGEIDTLDFSSYIHELTENLFLTYRLGNINISLNMDLEESLFFDMDTAVPLGMIVNELVSNSLKHAFMGRDRGEIRINLCREENEECINGIEESKNEDRKSTNFTLTVSDNCVGIPENIEIEDLDTLGFQLVTSLVDQLDGELELKRNNGIEFIIRFTVTEKE